MTPDNMFIVFLWAFLFVFAILGLITAAIFMYMIAIDAKMARARRKGALTKEDWKDYT